MHHSLLISLSFCAFSLWKSDINRPPIVIFLTVRQVKWIQLILLLSTHLIWCRLLAFSLYTFPSSMIFITALYLLLTVSYVFHYFSWLVFLHFLFCPLNLSYYFVPTSTFFSTFLFNVCASTSQRSVEYKQHLMTLSFSYYYTCFDVRTFASFCWM